MRVQPKGWNDATLSNVWLQKVLLTHTKKKCALFVWDTFKGHLTDELESELKQKHNVKSTTNLQLLLTYLLLGTDKVQYYK